MTDLFGNVHIHVHMYMYTCITRAGHMYVCTCTCVCNKQYPPPSPPPVKQMGLCMNKCISITKSVSASLFQHFRNETKHFFKQYAFMTLFKHDPHFFNFLERRAANHPDTLVHVHVQSTAPVKWRLYSLGFT